MHMEQRETRLKGFGLWSMWTAVTTASGIAVDMILLPWFAQYTFITFFTMMLLPIVTICIAQLLTLHRLFHTIYDGILPITTTISLLCMCIFVPWISVYIGVFNMTNLTQHANGFALPLIMLGALIIGLLLALLQFPFIASPRARWWYLFQGLAWGISWSFSLQVIMKMTQPLTPPSPLILLTWLSIWFIMGTISGIGIVWIRR